MNSNVNISDFASPKRQLERFQSEFKDNVNLFNELVEMASKHPNTVILEDISGNITYKKLLIGSHLMSKKLKPRLKKHKNIGLFLPNSIGHVVALFSLFKIGKTPCILNFSMGEQTLLDCMDTANVNVILTSRVFVQQGGFEKVMEALKTKAEIIYLEDIKKEATAVDMLKSFISYKLKVRSHQTTNELVLFTSGTESKPKGVVLTHTNLHSNIKQALSVIDISNKDVIFNALPMFHSFGLTVGALMPIIGHIPGYLYPSPLHYKEIPTLFFKKRGTIMVGTSTFFEGYAKNAKEHEFANCRYAITGAEKLKDTVRMMWQEKFGVRILEGYGATETSPILALNTPFFYRLGTVGKIIPGMEYKIEPVEGIEKGGSLLVKGPNVMKGYLIHGQGFVPCGEWYNTGDVVTIDEEGYISIQSRLKRFAKIAGEMVSLNQIEQLAMECFDDSGFYAVNIPDEKKGERIILFTTLKEADEKKLKKFIKSKKVSSLLIPYAMDLIEEVPLLASGKTDYVTLTEQAKSLKKSWFK